jgi:hypothetical protein
VTRVRKIKDNIQDDHKIKYTLVTGTTDVGGYIKEITTLQYIGSERKDPRDRPERRLVPTEFADPQCPLCMHIIQEINETFEHDDTLCQDPNEYCMTRLEREDDILIERFARQLSEYEQELYEKDAYIIELEGDLRQTQNASIYKEDSL